jgi:hypothetical protein
MAVRPLSSTEENTITTLRTLELTTGWEWMAALNAAKGSGLTLTTDKSANGTQPDCLWSGVQKSAT